MNTQSTAMPESFDSQRIAPELSATQPLLWSVRRELWEYRSIYVAPLAVAAVMLFGFLIATIGRAMSMDPARRAAVLTEPNDFAALLIMGTAFIVGGFYSLEALHGERRDRSILFWKSLPVSDLLTVLSKASIPLVVLPLLGFVLTVATQLILLLLSSAVQLASGQSVATHQPGFFETSLVMLYHILTSHGLWYAPIYGWLLLVSAWARRAAFLWATLPLLAIGVVEKIAFNTSYFADMLKQRLMGGPDGAFPSSGMSGGMPMASLAQLTPGQFLMSPGLWFGLFLAAIFLTAAVRLRRSQGPI